jgi:hypothetical protein
MRTIIVLLFAFLPLSACDQQKEVDQEAVRKFFAKNRVGPSPDYAIMKNGTDHLATIHGYMNDRETCLQLIEPYNKNPSLSLLPGTYTCVALNK